MFPQIRSFVPFYTLGGYLFVYKVYPLRTPFTMIVYFDQSRVDSCLNANQLLSLNQPIAILDVWGLKLFIFFSGGIGGI